MSRISDHNTIRRRRGFTLVEVIVTTGLSGIVLAGVLSAYLFLGRNLTRLAHFQKQEVEGRRVLRQFTQDLSAAINLTTTTSSQVVLTKPTAGGNTTVTYTYNSTAATMSRTDAIGTQKILSGITSFTIGYYNEAGTEVSGSPQSVKAVELTYASAWGNAANGTESRYSAVSPRVVLRNKAVLQ